MVSNLARKNHEKQQALIDNHPDSKSGNKLPGSKHLIANQILNSNRTGAARHHGTNSHDFRGHIDSRALLDKGAKIGND